MRKKQGTKQQRRDGTTMNMVHGQPRVGKEIWPFMPSGSAETCNGSSRDIKRKHSTIDGL